MSLRQLRSWYGAQIVRGTSAAAKTSETLVPAVGNKKIVVDYLVVSSDGIITFELQSDSTGIGPKLYVAANAGVALDTPFIPTNKGEALKLTTTIATTANYSYYLIYHVIGGEGNG